MTPAPNGTGWADRSPHPHLRPVHPVPIFFRGGRAAWV